MSIIKDSDTYVLNTYSRYQLEFEYGDGVWIYTTDGKKFLDLSSGIAVTALGHAHPDLIEAVCEQSTRLMHTSNLYYTGPYTRLAKRLVELSVFDRVFFCNSGAEANEAAIKLVRKHGNESGVEGKHQIITMKNSFHGRTMTTITATGQKKYQLGFDPVALGFAYASLNDIEDLKKTISDKTCAVFVEVVQGEGGIRTADMEYIKACRELCDKHNALLIFDEVQTGIGRTGKLFGYEHYLPVEPDGITLAKALGGGMPIGAFMVKEKYAQYLGPGTHASTFGGNPVCCSSALAVLDVIERDNVLDNVNKMSSYFFEQLNELKKKHPVIKEIRGIGFLIGMEIDGNNAELIQRLIEHNIIAVPAGKNVVRFLPALIITKSEIDYLIEILDKVL